MKNNKKESINICFACYDNYAQHTGVVISSVLQNYKGNFTLNFFVVYSYISPENIEKLKELQLSTADSYVEPLMDAAEKLQVQPSQSTILDITELMQKQSKSSDNRT